MKTTVLLIVWSLINQLFITSGHWGLGGRARLLAEQHLPRDELRRPGRQWREGAAADAAQAQAGRVHPGRWRGQHPREEDQEHHTGLGLRRLHKQEIKSNVSEALPKKTDEGVLFPLHFVISLTVFFRAQKCYTDSAVYSIWTVGS